MGSLKDAMVSAGLASTEESEEKPREKAAQAPAPATALANETHEESGSSAQAGASPAPAPAASAPPAEKACAKCGTMFTPKHVKHRLCPKCAEAEFAGKPKTAPSEATGAPAPVAAAPKPERRERPPRPAPSGRMGAPASDTHDAQAREREREREAPQGFPRDYLQSGYFAGKVLRDDVFDTWARHVAGLLVSRGLSSTQMRVFYGHVLRAQEAVRAGREFPEVYESLMKMRPAAAARLGRKAIPGEFADFLDRNLDQVKDPRTLHAFAEHFQAVVGYTAGRLRK